MAVVYLLHASGEIGSERKRAQHYLGFARRLKDRLLNHGGGNPAKGAHITAAFVKAGHTLTVARVWDCGADEHGAYLLEKSLKARKRASKLCPMCREGVPHPVKGKVLSVRFSPTDGAVLTETKVDRRRRKAA